MLGLPGSSEYNRRIPKQKFYENLSVTSSQKHIFINQIKAIYWRNKIASTTMNLAEGINVKEIEVFEVKLSEPVLDESVLRLIDREIPYHILFMLEHEGKYQAWTAYKETAGSGKGIYKVGNYYHTGWLTEEEIPIEIEGLTLDAVYENFVRQIAGDELRTQKGESLKETVDRNEKRKRVEKQIASLQAKIRREKQFNKQVEMSAELRKLKRDLEES